jgi:hypothetical protein
MDKTLDLGDIARLGGDDRVEIRRLGTVVADDSVFEQTIDLLETRKRRETDARAEQTQASSGAESPPTPRPIPTPEVPKKPPSGIRFYSRH